MRRIAIEEAFSLKSVETQVQNLAHSSFLPDEALQNWSRLLEEFFEVRIADMDANGIDVQVLSLCAPGIQGVDDVAQAINDAKRANDYLASVIEKGQGRFAGLAALPLQDPVAAVAELDRAVNELDLKGALVNGHTQGKYLDHEEFLPVWEALEGLDTPLYLHPGAPTREGWHVLEGCPELRGPSWSWAAETSAHALRIVYGRVVDDHQKSRPAINRIRAADLTR